MIPLLCGVLLALGVGDLDRAERAYRAGRFREALAGYEASLADPQVSRGRVLYNMGSCAFRLGRYAEAALHYRRARLRLPRDPEVAFNLRLAESRLGRDPPAVESFGDAVEAFAGSFTPREMLLLVGILEAAGLVGLVLLRRRRAARSVPAMLLIVALAGAARLVGGRWFPGPPLGVVLEPSALRSEPRPGDPVLLEMEAGDTVRVLEVSERWMRVRHPKGQGWTERRDVGVVD